MANLIGFEQDPDMPEGVGTFAFEDGSTIYGQDPELAASIGATPNQSTWAPPEQPEQPMDIGQPMLPQSIGASAYAPPPPPPEARPPMPPPSPRLEPDAPAAPRPQAQPEAAQPMQGAQQAPSVTPQRALQGQWMPGVNPQAMIENGVMVPRGQTVQTDTIYTPEDRDAMSSANIERRLARQAEADTITARAVEQARIADRDMLNAQKQAAEAQRKYDEDLARYQQTKARTMKEIEDFDKSAKVDPNRIFSGTGGTIARIGSIIGQALGAYAATLSGGRNWAKEAVDAEIDRDIAAQKEEIAQGRISQGNKLYKLQREFGDMQSAETALRAIQKNVAAKEVQKFAAINQAEDAQLAFQRWDSENQAELVELDRKLRSDAMGKRTVTSEFVQPRAGRFVSGGGDIITKQTKENERAAKLLESETRLDKAKRDRKGDDELYVEGYGWARDKSEARRLRLAIAEAKARDKELDQIEKLNKDPWAKVGVKVPDWIPGVGGTSIGTDEYNEARTRAQRALTTEAKSYGGVITESDIERAAEATPDPSRIFGGQETKVKVAREANKRLLNEEIQQILKGNNPGLPQERE